MVVYVLFMLVSAVPRVFLVYIHDLAAKKRVGLALMSKLFKFLDNCCSCVEKV